METALNSLLDILTCRNLFLNTREYDDIRIHRHTNGKNNTCNTRKCQRDIKQIQTQDRKCCISNQSQYRDHTREPVHNDHDNRYTDQTDHTGKKRRPYGILS